MATAWSATQWAAITVHCSTAYTPSQPTSSFMQDSVRAQRGPAAPWGPVATGDPRGGCSRTWPRSQRPSRCHQPGNGAGPGSRQEPGSEARPGHQPWSRGPDGQGPWPGVGTAGAGEQHTSGGAGSSETGLRGARVESDWSGQLRPVRDLKALTSRTNIFGVFLNN